MNFVFVSIVLSAAMISCSSSNHSSSVDHQSAVEIKPAAQPVVNKPWVLESGVVRDDPTTWPTRIIDKCSTAFCREIKTPYGIYKIIDARGEPDMRDLIMTAQSGSAYNYKALNSALKTLELDLLRMGCKRTVDSYCSNNYFDFKSNCADDFNFGSSKLSICEKPQQPEPYFRELIQITSCGVGNGEVRDVGYFEGTLDEAIENMFDTRCVKW